MSNLRAFREKANLTQEELGKQCGFRSPQSRIALYESGGRTPSLSISRLLVKNLNRAGADCTLDDVFPPEEITAQPLTT
jgi:putative transcriptional regulator